VLRPDYPLETDRLLLRPFSAEDLDAWFEYQSRPDVARFLPWEARDAEQTRRALTTKIGQHEIVEEGGGLALAVVLREGGTLVGDVSLVWLSREHRQGEIGFVFHPDHHGRGYATEAAEVMLRLAFAGLGLHRVIGRCDALNTASARLMVRLGMRQEAHFVHNEIFKGDWGDELVFALLATEWHERHAAAPA